MSLFGTDAKGRAIRRTLVVCALDLVLGIAMGLIASKPIFFGVAGVGVVCAGSLIYRHWGRGTAG